ncbi:3-phosphoshikimate 1-carboxyvinyltransferase [Devriesea agamarum]|uniref:3-phosphoshikimate 1-carboxyvinyltransferase n=1 Tax=Devriesea agamarum TaxID=472569 RepID=UPI00071C48A3|nr:3-phosphoshikimate 1-carboxyvinyltransferase [Devriesea agamarum]
MSSREVLWTAPTADSPLDALVEVPGSKSLTNRWLVLGALADSTTSLHGVLISRDTRLMVDALQQLGASFRRDGASCHITPLTPDASIDMARAPMSAPGDGSVGSRRQPTTIHCGLAGTVMRFVPPVAALTGKTVDFVGDPAASSRPMSALVEGLRAQGVRVDDLGKPGRLPLRLYGDGDLAGGTIEVDASASSQVISGLLLSAPRGRRTLVIRHTGARLPSVPHIDMTLEVLRRSGVDAEHRMSIDGRTHEWAVVPGPVHLGEVVIEPDLSNAGPFLAAAMVTGGTIAISRWPRHTTQPGDAYRDLLTRMGADIHFEDDELVLTGTGVIHGIDEDLGDVGELTCTIAALAVLADSPSHLRGIGHLRGHETDRLHALTTEIRRLGGDVVEHEDSLEIKPRPLHGGVVQTYEDHRMATAAAIIGLRVPGVQVVNVQTTEKTLPDFVDMWLSMLHTCSPAGGTW